MVVRNKVMQLWIAVVTAVLALGAALGLITANTAAAAPRAERSGSSAPEKAPAPHAPVARPWSWSLVKALPPTMKQRIHAEAHGKTPTCRHTPLEDADAALAEHPCQTKGSEAATAGETAGTATSAGTVSTADATGEAAGSAAVTLPLQR